MKFMVCMILVPFWSPRHSLALMSQEMNESPASERLHPRQPRHFSGETNLAARHAETERAPMMIDYHVSDDWPVDEPVWIRSLVSSLSRQGSTTAVLPLTVVVQEILDWVELASGEDAWANKYNRASLQADLDQSVAALGPSLLAEVAAPLVAFQMGLSNLYARGRAVHEQGAGMRTDQSWLDLDTTARSLSGALVSDAAVGACWEDLVAIAKERALEGRQYRPVADLLYDMMRLRGRAAEQVSRQAVAMLAYGQEPDDFPFEERALRVEERVSKARAVIVTPPVIEPVAVWLGYKGGGHVPVIGAGNVHFFNAAWHIPNSKQGRPDFPHKVELAEIVKYGGLFKWQERIGEEYDVDFLVRVDLGETTASGAFEQAAAIVDTILTVAIHDSNGIRPHLAQYVVVRSGWPAESSFMVSRADLSFPDDHHGARLVAEGLERHAAKIADALANAELPRFLAAALEAQTAADLPFSRAYALRKPSEADRRAVIPLTDRGVQHVAAFAAMKPSELFQALTTKWAHARWITDVQNGTNRKYVPS